MNANSEQLERLVTRFLDGECTPDERRELNAIVATDPRAQAFYEAMAAMDREIGAALRLEAKRTKPAFGKHAGWQRILNGIGVAVAAGMIALTWFAPQTPPTDGANTTQPTQAGHTFSWQCVPVDGRVQTDERLFEYPHAGIQHTQRNWILVPGKNPNQYYLIQVDQTQMNAITIQREL